MHGLSTNSEVRAWWWQPSKGKRNFGDELGYHILKKMGFKVKRVGLKNADIVLGGTTMDIVERKAKDGCMIWGAGVGWSHQIDDRFNVLAVRGWISADSLNYIGVVGDIGLLVSRYWSKEPPIYDFGVVRHYVDKNEYDYADIVIDATEPVDVVIKKISQCRSIASSSLHGLIVAQSFGIPAMRIHHDEVISGDVKWLDYQSALSKPIEQIQDELIEVLWT